MSKISAEEIYIGSDMRAFFLEGQKDPNDWQSTDQRLFVQEFLRFYNSEVLQPEESFHYETFFDFYSFYLHEWRDREKIELFCKRFADKYFNGRDTIDPYNRVAAFNRTFNQLIANQLSIFEYHANVGLLGYPIYGGLVRFLKELLETHDVNVHTLNHDLFFEWVGQHHTDLFQHFCDGYQLAGSPFFGHLSEVKAYKEQTINKRYLVKVPFYSGRYDKPLRLFKLHGGVQTTVVYGDNGERTRIKPDYGVGEFMVETQSESGDWEFKQLWDQVEPDFLSGTTNKIRFYDADPFYRNLFSHFRENLSKSDFLLVIGYGFRDAGVNEYLEKYYLSRGCEMIVVDPGKPNPELIQKYTTNHLSIDGSQAPYELFRELLPR